MKPSIHQVLSALSALIVREVSPALGNTYLSQQVQRSAALLGAVAEEFDRAAARRIQENRALRQIFREAVPLVPDPDLAQALSDALPEAALDEDLRVSRLDAENQVLRALLIRLHAWAEADPSAAGKRLNTAIWAELRHSTERRNLTMGRY